MDEPTIPGLTVKTPRTPQQMSADIPAMPVVAMRVMRELADPRTTAKKISDIISVDQAMTSRVLRIANSPVFGVRRKITTVADALVLMGFSAMKGLVITVSTRGIYRHAGMLEQLLWEHSVGSAVASATIARVAGGWPPDEAFVAGLLHDIGRAVFANLYRKDYEVLFQYLYNHNLPRSALVALEERYFGMSHMDVGKMVVAKWNLPEDILAVVSHHHIKSLEDLKALPKPWPVAVVGLADSACRHLGVGMREPDTSGPLYNSPFAEFLKLSAEQVAGILEQTLELFESEKATFEM
ncbi:MAG: HDOD domain-containing protein [Candidatus Sumerlaeota bacterium]|nr:HDOD domain-containing protein [Candidatus Sumerlaeota bacterium]